MKILRHCLVCAGVLGLAANQPLANADTLNASMPVSFTINAGCTSFTAGSLDFSASEAGPPTAQTTISVTCNAGTHYNIYSSGGTNDTCSEMLIYDYHMSNGAIQIPYRIFTDVGGTSELAHQGLNGCSSLAPDIMGTGDGSPQNYALYAYAYGSGPAGTYTDTVTLTVSF